MNYWQVAAGDGNRDYSELFLKYGVMLIGPGDPGEYFENKEYYQKGNLNNIVAFAEEVADGDIVILKKPSGKSWEIIAIGTVKDGYEYKPVFGDVEGWDLQHCRYVEWKKFNKNPIINGLTRGTFKRINNSTVITQITKMLKTATTATSPTKLSVPEPPKKLSDEELIDILIDHGLRPKNAEDFTQAIHRIRRLVKWYLKWYYTGISVGEHETRSFLILPLLLALGWPEQKLKIEWNNIDIAFFDKPYRNPKKEKPQCITILESKKLMAGLDYAIHQASSYASKYPKCSRLIVSDGCRYKLFTLDKQSNTWKYSAYLNILEPRLTHPYEPDVLGAPDVFLSLMEKS